MSAVWGEKLKITIFGESHGFCVGVVLDGIPAGTEIDYKAIAFHAVRRAPGQRLTTPRKEADEVKIMSGVLNGVATGAPICAMIENTNTRSSDYEPSILRPGHADYSTFIKYKGFADHRGGGHFSGRLTAGLVFAGSVVRSILEKKGILIGAHLLQVGNVKDKAFDVEPTGEQLKALWQKPLPVLLPIDEEISFEIEQVHSKGDSIGGAIECACINLPAGLGEPFFDSVESTLSHLLFSIGGVKGVFFGNGANAASMQGSQFNDPWRMSEGKIISPTNNSGGINGGITNGLPIVFTVNMRPTASISQMQRTVNIETMQETEINIQGRHDPCIALRAVPVIESAAALAIYDLYLRSDLL